MLWWLQRDVKGVLCYHHDCFCSRVWRFMTDQGTGNIYWPVGKRFGMVRKRCYWSTKVMMVAAILARAPESPRYGGLLSKSYLCIKAVFVIGTSKQDSSCPAI